MLGSVRSERTGRLPVKVEVAPVPVKVRTRVVIPRVIRPVVVMVVVMSPVVAMVVMMMAMVMMGAVGRFGRCGWHGEGKQHSGGGHGCK